MLLSDLRAIDLMPESVGMAALPVGHDGWRASRSANLSAVRLANYLFMIIKKKKKQQQAAADSGGILTRLRQAYSRSDRLNFCSAIKSVDQVLYQGSFSISRVC